MTVWDNPMLSIPELQVMSGKSHTWLSAVMRREEDPLPNGCVGTECKVLWSDYCDWFKRNYGLEGPLRGSERRTRY